MSIEVNIVDSDGNKLVFKSAKNIAARTRFGVEKALWRSGKDIQAEFSKQVLAKNKTGHIYIRRIKGGERRHRASAAGETPANRTGKYRKSFNFSVDGAHQLTAGLEAVSFTPSGIYPFYLEDGTKRMAARPGLKNSIRSSERNIIRNLSTAIKDLI